MDSKILLEEFISFPVDNVQQVMDKFATLPGAIYKKGSEPMQQFVYVPGARKDRVVLVAHADTVWDAVYGNPKQQKIVYIDGVFQSADPDCGIGADDRAGCAMVWALRDSGHSLLILSGEEKGKHGAKYLRDAYPSLYKEINEHCYILEFDWASSGGCLFNQVDNTQRFKRFVAEDMGFVDSKKKGGCDLQVLCKKICGVNLSVGWQNCHRGSEMLVLSDWEKTYETMTAFLLTPQRRFRTSISIRLRRFIIKVKNKLGSIARKLLGKNRN